MGAAKAVARQASGAEKQQAERGDRGNGAAIATSLGAPDWGEVKAWGNYF